MDNNKEKNLERRKRKKRDAPKSNDYQTDIMSQEKIFIQDRKKKRKKEKEEKKKTMNDSNNDATANMDISKGDLNENVKDLSKRQLKRKKAAELEEAKMELRKTCARQKAYRYVLMWKHHRNEWKFEKLKQIWLIDNLMNPNSVSNKCFPIVLEYFKNCKGKAREVLVQKAMEVIKKAETEKNECDKEEIMNTCTYKRARQLLQILPHDNES